MTTILSTAAIAAALIVLAALGLTVVAQVEALRANRPDPVSRTHLVTLACGTLAVLALAFWGGVSG